MNAEYAEFSALFPRIPGSQRRNPNSFYLANFAYNGTMEILEHKAQWRTNFRQGWLANAQRTGKADWSLYEHPRNERVPGAPGVDLRKSRVMLISTSGAFVPGKHKPFAEESVFGDYSVRHLSSALPVPELDFAHGHYDEQFIRADLQVAIPLGHLREKVGLGAIKELAPTVISFMGYQPNSARVVDEVVPHIEATAKAEHVDAAILAPL